MLSRRPRLHHVERTLADLVPDWPPNTSSESAAPPAPRVIDVCSREVLERPSDLELLVDAVQACRITAARLDAVLHRVNTAQLARETGVCLRTLWRWPAQLQARLDGMMARLNQAERSGDKPVERLVT